MNSVSCTCAEVGGCPVCDSFRQTGKFKKRHMYMMPILDADGSLKVLSLSESAYKMIVAKARRKNLAYRIRGFLMRVWINFLTSLRRFSSLLVNPKQQKG